MCFPRLWMSDKVSKHCVQSRTWALKLQYSLFLGAFPTQPASSSRCSSQARQTLTQIQRSDILNKWSTYQGNICWHYGTEGYLQRQCTMMGCLTGVWFRLAISGHSISYLCCEFPTFCSCVVVLKCSNVCHLLCAEGARVSWTAWQLQEPLCFAHLPTAWTESQQQGKSGCSQV